MENREFSKEVDESGVFDKYLPLEDVKETRKLATIDIPSIETEETEPDAEIRRIKNEILKESAEYMNPGLFNPIAEDKLSTFQNKLRKIHGNVAQHFKPKENMVILDFIATINEKDLES